ncbi:VOC family protein [Amycolatopsis pithecellobii]|uniref:Catechol 1,2-dioxygenase n=1 Tax=Amycolatopsis pithecellobii TaxID=664692 RepID=A0A6N7YI92_9PSEU|nr:VOC family protein [Amycolatopsis pithecellobii]MTD52625.1 catechol 1,2-dioxygenase [Amycolatopsis pithecellobii]
MENITMSRRTVSQLAYVELATPDLQKSRDFFVNVLGLTEIAQTGDGIFLRAWGDFLPYSLQLVEGPVPEARRIGWRADSAEDLEHVVEVLKADGREGEWTGENIGRGRAYQFRSPGGHGHEIFWDIKQLAVPEELRSTYPNRRQKFSPVGVAARTIDHVTFGTDDVLRDVLWFRDKLNFRYMEYTALDESPETVFFGMVSSTEQAHNLGIMQNATDVRGAVHHVAYWVDQEIDVYRAADVLIEAGFPVEFGPGKHGMGENTFLYVREPSGFRIELFSGGYRNYMPDWEPVGWTPSRGSLDAFRNRSVPDSINELFPGGRAGAIDHNGTAEQSPFAIPGIS